MGTINDGTTTYSFIRITGAPDELGEQVETITRPNVDGQAYRTIGQRGRPFTIQTVRDLDTRSDVESNVSAYKAMQGTLVTLTDDHGTSYSNVMVLDVREVRRFVLNNPVGGETSGNWIVVMRWRMQLTE